MTVTKSMDAKKIMTPKMRILKGFTEELEFTLRSIKTEIELAQKDLELCVDHTSDPEKPCENEDRHLEAIKVLESFNDEKRHMIVTCIKQKAHIGGIKSIRDWGGITLGKNFDLRTAKRVYEIIRAWHGVKMFEDTQNNGWAPLTYEKTNRRNGMKISTVLVPKDVWDMFQSSIAARLGYRVDLTQDCFKITGEDKAWMASFQNVNGPIEIWAYANGAVTKLS